ncbi:hypothetical protein [Arthrobacter sp. EpRS71]|uniref:hypothetical protein n=1 Tax=Arthrobacter sp. EpRS71 TaxID=1743141 RepID=UPI0007848789|nr:hypothetical protein [Arthrobacter sp. EpRS71]
MAKGNSALDVRELRAAQAVRSVYGAARWEITPRDVDGAPSGTHDFDLSDGTTTVAVEVTTIAETDTLRDSAQFNYHFPNLAADFDGLKQGWLVAVSSGGNAREIRQQLETWLAELERLTVPSVDSVSLQQHLFSSEADRPVWYSTLVAMHAAGVISAGVVPTLPAGHCTLAKIDDGFSWDPTDPEYVSTFVSEQLAGKHLSDVQKMGRAVANRRVLFLWLDVESHFDITRRLDNGLLGGTVRNVGLVDEVWIGRHFTSNDVTVYRWREADGWDVRHLQETDLVNP